MFLAVTEDAKELTISKRRKAFYGISAVARAFVHVLTNVTRKPSFRGHFDWVTAIPGGNNGGMNVIVCVKQIPDPAAPGALDGATNTLKRDGKLILDDSDAYGVEMALQLVDKAGGGEVSLVSMAPNSETSGLRTALAMGAAKGVLISDPALQGSDALTTEIGRAHV